jgi:hypothetical protein
MAEVAETPVVAEAWSAPTYRRLLYQDSLAADGIPLQLREITDLGVFGVKPVDLLGEPKCLSCVPRDDDDRLTKALGDAASSKRLLLVVGDSGSGKTRSTAQAARNAFPAHRLLRPAEHQLPELSDICLADVGPAIVWLDDMEKYAHPALRAILERLVGTGAGAVVVGTIRREELRALSVSGEIRNPSGVALTDQRLVLRLDWKREWSQTERDRTPEYVANPLAQASVAAGLPLGVWAVAGPQLLNKLNEARFDEDYPCRFALVRVVLDWYRTGMMKPTPRSVADDLINDVYLDQPASENDLSEAFT